MLPTEIRDLYCCEGKYINFPSILDLGYKTTVIVSLRGGGKTYGALKYMLESGERFMYFRRTGKALEMATDVNFHIFTELNADLGRHVTPSLNHKTGLGVFEEDGEIIGYAANLGTFGSIRSLGSAKALGIKWLIFDEFIPQAEEVRRYDLYSAWQNAVETLTRNAEIDGYKVHRLLMANADTIRGDVIAGLNIADDFLAMQEQGIEAAIHSRDTLLVRPQCDTLMKLKADTSLYRDAEGTDFANIALANLFRVDDRPMIAKRNLQEYKPVVSIDGICIYRHKSRKEYYVSQTKAGKPKEYSAGEADHKRYIRDNMSIWQAFLNKHVLYDSVRSQTIFRRLYKLD